MIKSFMISISMVFIQFQASTKATEQSIECFDWWGDSVTFQGPVNNLGQFGYDNKIRKICATGTWILYEDTDFNIQSTGAANFWYIGQNSCTDLPEQFQDKASSLRNAGVQSDDKKAGINFYTGEFFMGKEEFISEETRQLELNDEVESMIVSGCEAWTLYPDANMHDENGCLCVFPADKDNCTPGLYKTAKSLGGMGGKVSSASPGGCYCDKEAQPDNHGQRDHTEL
eukprot:TRINITY_DN7169_c0_g1_i3.p1 TRINITY_DN7169_c0_g1~~TRINITY_DN7169_c0_g1_i3.p1  ORF type:complete len:228 (+),score=51.78 TRINITY_DN7169_c0_g1_i3:39-722(+)